MGGNEGAINHSGFKREQNRSWGWGFFLSKKQGNFIATRAYFRFFRCITDEALAALADKCEQLRDLRIMDTIITDQGVKVG